MAAAGDRRRRGRLSRSGDFKRAYRDGSSRANRFLVLYAFPRPEDDDADATRLGISVGRKVGNAVERNRVKRVLREAFWGLGEALPEGFDFVIVARADAGEMIDGVDQGELTASIAELVTEATAGEGER